jgi:large subunit ribosomal protein L25
MAPEADLKHAMSGADGHGRVEIQVAGGKAFKAIVRDVDKDYLHNRILHVTLLEVAADDQVKIDVPVVAVGVPEAVDNNLAILMNPTDHLKVRGRMDDMPERFEIDVSQMTMEQSISAGDVALPEGFTLLSSPDSIVFLVQAIRTAAEGETSGEGEAEAPAGETEETS